MNRRDALKSLVTLPMAATTIRRHELTAIMGAADPVIPVSLNVLLSCDITRFKADIEKLYRGFPAGT